MGICDLSQVRQVWVKRRKQLQRRARTRVQLGNVEGLVKVYRQVKINDSYPNEAKREKISGKELLRKCHSLARIEGGAKLVPFLIQGQLAVVNHLVHVFFE